MINFSTISFILLILLKTKYILTTNTLVLRLIILYII